MEKLWNRENLAGVWSRDIDHVSGHVTGGGVLGGAGLPVSSEGVDGLHVQSGAPGRRRSFEFLQLQLHDIFFHWNTRKKNKVLIFLNEKIKICHKRRTTQMKNIQIHMHSYILTRINQTKNK